MEKNKVDMLEISAPVRLLLDRLWAERPYVRSCPFCRSDGPEIGIIEEDDVFWCRCPGCAAEGPMTRSADDACKAWGLAIRDNDSQTERSLKTEPRLG